MTTASYPDETPNEARQRWHTEARERDEAYLALGPIDDTEPEDSPGIDVEQLHASMAAAGLRIVAGPGPLRSVLPDAINKLSGADCVGCHCCPAGACEPGEPLGPGVCGHTCPCHPDFWREMYDVHFPGEPA